MVAVLMMLLLFLLTLDHTAAAATYRSATKNQATSAAASDVPSTFYSSSAHLIKLYGPVAAGSTGSRKLLHHHHDDHHHQPRRHPQRTRTDTISPSPSSIPGRVAVSTGSRKLLHHHHDHYHHHHHHDHYHHHHHHEHYHHHHDHYHHHHDHYHRHRHRHPQRTRTHAISPSPSSISGLPIAPNEPNDGPRRSPVTQSLPVTPNFDKRSQKITIIIISLSAVVVLLIACCAATFVLLMYKRCGFGAVFSTSAFTDSTMPSSLLSIKTFSLAELSKATKKFSSKRVLGEGGFGRVYYGVMEDGLEVAVKFLKNNNQNEDRDFFAEVEMLSRLRHRNLVKLIGICIERHRRCLVYELVPNGSVESHLHDKQKGFLDWDARLKIALGAARGLAYLHEDSSPRVIHCDFKPANVLLEDDFTPKISDFGFAREATEGCDHISTGVMGTFGYVAPEYAMTGHLRFESDVYSYGVVLLELLTGKRPIDMSRPPGEENLVIWSRSLLATQQGLQQLADPFLSGTYNLTEFAKVAAIAYWCVHPDIAQRPCMGEVVQALKQDSTVESPSSDGSWWNASPSLHDMTGASVHIGGYRSGPLKIGVDTSLSLYGTKVLFSSSNL